MQTEYYAGIALLILFLIISLTKESKKNAVGTKRGLDNIRNVMLVLFLIDIFKLLSACFLMTTKVIIGTVGNTPKLSPTEREQELDIGGGLRIERKLFLFVVAKSHIFLFDSEV